MTTDLGPVFTGIYNTYHEAALRMGQTDTEQLILYILCKNENRIDRNELYKKTGLSRVTVYTAINKLKKRGCLDQVKNTDRSTTVFMTEKGVELAENTVSKIIQMEEQVLSGWKASDKRHFAELTERYYAEIKEKVQDIK